MRPAPTTLHYQSGSLYTRSLFYIHAPTADRCRPLMKRCTQVTLGLGARPIRGVIFYVRFLQYKDLYSTIWLNNI